MLRYFLVLRLLVLKWSLSTGMWMQAHEAHKCRFYRHVDAGIGGTKVWVLQALPEGSTGGTEVWVLQAVREPRDRPESREVCGCKNRRHGNAANTGTDMLLLEARVSTLWM